MRRMLATPLRRVVLWLDDKTRLHDQIKPSSWWKTDGGPYEVLERAKDHPLDPKLKGQQDKLKALRDARREA